MVVGMAAYLSLAACVSVGSRSAGELTGKVWVLDSLNGAAPVPDATITAEFTKMVKWGDRQVANSYSGPYTMSGSKIEFHSPWLL